MPAIVEFPKVVLEALPDFADIFSCEPQRRHFAEYVTGLLVARKKNVSAINREFANTTDQSCLNKFLTEVVWNETALNERRLAVLQRDDATRYSDEGVIAIDDVLIDHEGKLIADVGWFHAEERHKIAHDYLFNLAGMPPLVSDQALLDLCPYLGQCNIRELGLGGTPVSDEGVKAVIQHCHSTLRQLELSGTRVTGATIESLRECPNLKFVSISVEALSEPGIDALGVMPRLRKVSVFNSDPSDHRIERLRSIRPDLDIYVSQRSHFLDR